MTPVRLSFRYKFTLFLSCSSLFVYMTPAEISYQSESYQCVYTPDSLPDQDFHSGMKTHPGVIQTWYDWYIFLLVSTISLQNKTHTAIKHV